MNLVCENPIWDHCRHTLRQLKEALIGSRSLDFVQEKTKKIIAILMNMRLHLYISERRHIIVLNVLERQNGIMRSIR